MTVFRKGGVMDPDADKVFPISEPRSLYRLRDKLRGRPSDAKVELSTATLLMLVEELIEARKAK